MESRRHAVSVFQTQSSLRFQAGIIRMTSDSRSFCCDWCSAITGLLKAAAFLYINAHLRHIFMLGGTSPRFSTVHSNCGGHQRLMFGSAKRP